MWEVQYDFQIHKKASRVCFFFLEINNQIWGKLLNRYTSKKEIFPKILNRSYIFFSEKLKNFVKMYFFLDTKVLESLDNTVQYSAPDKRGWRPG